MDTLKNGVTALDERAKEHGAGVDFTSRGVRKPGDEATLRLRILGLRIGRVSAPAHISTAACWMTARGYSSSCRLNWHGTAENHEPQLQTPNERGETSSM